MPAVRLPSPILLFSYPPSASRISRSPLVHREGEFDGTQPTKGVRIQSWRQEVVPFEQFNVGIKRIPLDWYAETPYEKSRHDDRDNEDVSGIGYLRHVRGIAMDHINGL